MRSPGQRDRACGVLEEERMDLVLGELETPGLARP